MPHEQLLTVIGDDARGQAIARVIGALDHLPRRGGGGGTTAFLHALRMATLWEACMPSLGLSPPLWIGATPAYVGSAQLCSCGSMQGPQRAQQHNIATPALRTSSRELNLSTLCTGPKISAGQGGRQAGGRRAGLVGQLSAATSEQAGRQAGHLGGGHAPWMPHVSQAASTRRASASGAALAKAAHADSQFPGRDFH